jgi:hypothetical protein
MRGNRELLGSKAAKLDGSCDHLRPRGRTAQGDHRVDYERHEPPLFQVLAALEKHVVCPPLDDEGTDRPRGCL